MTKGDASPLDTPYLFVRAYRRFRVNFRTPKRQATCGVEPEQTSNWANHGDTSHALPRVSVRLPQLRAELGNVQIARDCRQREVRRDAFLRRGVGAEP